MNTTSWRRRFAALTFSIALTLPLLASSSNSAEQRTAHADGTKLAQVVLPPLMPIPLHNATPIAIPKPVNPLTPTPFKPSPTKLKGWVIQLPGNHPICTPAYYHGKLYVGGGYGSYDFYAFDATTGKLAWKYHTNDDGPTAAVVEDGCVAFNTESCTVFVLDAKTGKELWKEWLGDPLMSQPAISKGKLFIAYPSGQRGHGTYGHALLCADLHTGKHYWNKPISGDIISAPIIENDRVYLSCMDGNSYCFSADNGALIWKKEGAATSAPVVHNGKLMVAERATQGKDKEVQEGIRRVDAFKGVARDAQIIAAAKAPYMQGATNGTIGPQGGDATHVTGVNTAGTVRMKKWYQSMDSSVGFASAPQGAQLDAAQSNLGISSVAGAWGYQGARATYHDGAVTNTQLTYVNCVDAESGKVKWRAEAKAPFITGQTQVFSTPSLGKQNIYLCSGDGHLICMDQKTGGIKYMYSTGHAISFQPALANGNIYIGTATGELICINANDPDAEAWTAWGGNAQHNKVN